MRAAAAALLLHGACASLHHHEEMVHHAPGEQLLAAMPSASALERMILAFVKLDAKFALVGGVHRQYAVQDEARKWVVRAQELRVLFQDVGMPDGLMVNESATLMEHLLDRNNDGNVTLGEWSTAFDVLRCWLPTELSADASATEIDQHMGKLRHLGNLVEQLSTTFSIENAVTLQAELHRCPAIAKWWNGGKKTTGWFERLAKFELGTILQKALRLKKWVCAGRLPDRILSHTDITVKPHLGDLLAVRTAFKLDLGITSLLMRQLAAIKFIALLDTNGDDKLSHKEMHTPAIETCLVYAAILERDTTFFAVLRALMLPTPHGYPLNLFVSHVEAGRGEQATMDPDRLKLAHQAIEDKNAPLNSESLAALLELYIHLAPKDALPVQEELHDEL